MIEEIIAPVAPETQNAEQPPHPVGDTRFFKSLLRYRDALGAFLQRVAEAAEAHPWLVFLALLAIAIPAILGQSLSRPLWHDEIITSLESQQPTYAAMWHAVQIIDMTPPLPFLLTRASYHVFGVNALTTRLPDMVGFLVAMLSLFVFVRRRAGTLYALLASTLFYTGVAFPLAAEARPYGLMLGSGALGLLSWQIARTNRRLGVPLLLLSGVAILLNHVFGAFLWFALALAEGLRIVERRKVDWPLVVAWTVPLLSIITWIPLIQQHTAHIFPLAFQPALRSILSFYDQAVFPDALPVLFAGLAMLLVAGRRSVSGSSYWYLSRYEWAAILLILLIPVPIIYRLSRTHAAFFSRYGIASALAVAVIGSILLAVWTKRDLRAPLFCIVFALILAKQFPLAAGAVLHQHVFTHVQPAIKPCEPCIVSARMNPSLPLVDGSGLAFVEMSQREDPETLQRVYYLTDQNAAAEYAHADIFEVLPIEKQLLHEGGNVAPYSEFIRQHHQFFVFGDYQYPEDWLLRKLMADGATLQFLGIYPSSYESHELYKVTLQ